MSIGERDFLHQNCIHVKNGEYGVKVEEVDLGDRSHLVIVARQGMEVTVAKDGRISSAAASWAQERSISKVFSNFNATGELGCQECLIYDKCRPEPNFIVIRLPGDLVENYHPTIISNLSEYEK